VKKRIEPVNSAGTFQSKQRPPPPERDDRPKKVTVGQNSTSKLPQGVKASPLPLSSPGSASRSSEPPDADWDVADLFASGLDVNDADAQTTRNLLSTSSRSRINSAAAHSGDPLVPDSVVEEPLSDEWDDPQPSPSPPKRAIPRVLQDEEFDLHESDDEAQAKPKPKAAPPPFVQPLDDADNDISVQLSGPDEPSPDSRGLGAGDSDSDLDLSVSLEGPDL
jgi:hypothetical protein